MPPSPHLLQCVNSQTISYKCRSFCKVSAMFIKIKTLQICQIPHKKRMTWKSSSALKECSKRLQSAMIIYHRHKSRGHKFTNPHLRKPRWMHQRYSAVFRSLPSGTFGCRSWDWTIDRLSGVKVWLCDGQYVFEMFLNESVREAKIHWWNKHGFSLYSGGQLTSFFVNVLKMHNVVFVGRVVRTHITVTHIKPTGATNWLRLLHEGPAGKGNTLHGVYFVCIFILTWPRSGCDWLVCTDHLLDEGVVGGVHAGAQRIKALSITVVRRVSSRSQNPVLSTKTQL